MHSRTVSVVFSLVLCSDTQLHRPADILNMPISPHISEFSLLLLSKKLGLKQMAVSN